MKTEYHDPVLLKESVDGLDIKANGTYVDVTFGGGGHSREILSRLGPDGKLFGFDQDTDAANNIPEDDRFQLIQANFRHLNRFLKFYNITEVDGILGDFGVSSHQFDSGARGFSTRFDGALDMRMDQSGALSAHEVVNQYSMEDLRAVLQQYGELRNGHTIANTIVEARTNGPIATTTDLKNVLAKFLPKHKEQKILAQVYQAIRIEVNQELQVIKELLLQAHDILTPNGRLSLISYHSLEDRLVKRFIRTGKFEGEVEKDFYGNAQVPFKKVGGLIVPSQEEINRNNRARSAKLRIAEKV